MSLAIRMKSLKIGKESERIIIIIIIIIINFFFFLRPPAQSLQATNCKLGVTSEMAHSLAQKLLGCESVSDRYFISSLQ